MNNCNPVREVLATLETIFQALNASCEILKEEVKALHFITDVPKKTISWRFKRSIGVPEFPKPKIEDGYVDKFKNITKMLRFVGDQYDDVKKEYLCVLDELAEIKVKLYRIEEDLVNQAHDKSFEEICDQPTIMCSLDNEKSQEELGILKELQFHNQELLTEVAEKDVLINVLKAEVKNKEEQIHQILKLERKKFGKSFCLEDPQLAE